MLGKRSMPSTIANDCDFYLIHYSPLKDRINYWTDTGLSAQLNLNIITENDILVNCPKFHDVSKSEISSFSFLLLINQYLRAQSEVFDNRLNTILNYSLSEEFIVSIQNNIKSVFTVGNEELISQHFTAICMFISSNSPYCIILEDDSTLNEAFKLKNINTFLNSFAYFQMRDMPIFCDLSKSLNLDMQPMITNYALFKNAWMYEVLPGQTQCSSAYMLNRRCAQLLMNLFLTNHSFMPIDFLLSYFLNRKRVTTLWPYFSYFSQGSMINQYKSNSLSRNLFS